MPDQLQIGVRSRGRGFDIDITYRGETVRVRDADPQWWSSLTERDQVAWADAWWGESMLSRPCATDPVNTPTGSGVDSKTRATEGEG